MLPIVVLTAACRVSGPVVLFVSGFPYRLGIFFSNLYRLMVAKARENKVMAYQKTHDSLPSKESGCLPGVIGRLGKEDSQPCRYHEQLGIIRNHHGVFKQSVLTFSDSRQIPSGCARDMADPHSMSMCQDRIALRQMSVQICRFRSKNIK